MSKTVYQQLGQKVSQKLVQSVEVEKYARIPDSVLFDADLSITAKCVYAVIARYVFQGNTAKLGQRLIAQKVSASKNTVNGAIRELSGRGFIAITGEGKARRIYTLSSKVFGQKQRSGVEEIICEPGSGVRRFASTRSA
jgi:hypothetical protein